MDGNLGKSSQTLTGLAILIAGKNTFGTTGDGTTISDIEFETVDGKSTGIVKQITMELEVCNLGAEYITHIASGLPFVLKGNLNIDGENLPVVEAVQGDLVKMGKDYKEGDKVKRKFTLNVNVYSEVVNNLPTVVYANDPYTIFLGGINMAPDFTDNI
jgi:hypothetical protein